MDLLQLPEPREALYARLRLVCSIMSSIDNESMSPYARTPLSEGEIRLIKAIKDRLDSDDPTDVPLYQFTRVRLDELGPEHQYCAISYVWGNPDKENAVVIEEGGSIGTVRVTDSAAPIFERLISRNSSTYYWIDAVCINQGQDPAALVERAAQVQQMHLVYARAEKVIAWLGVSREGGNRMAKILNDAVDCLADLFTKFALKHVPVLT
jgi:hypothetical protein